MSVRCKFLCHHVSKHLRGPYSDWVDGKEVKHASGFNYTAEMSAVTGYGESTSPENKQFWQATPSGTFKVECVKQDYFEPGKEYYLDISVAE